MTRRSYVLTAAGRSAAPRS